VPDTDLLIFIAMNLHECCILLTINFMQCNYQARSDSVKLPIPINVMQLFINPCWLIRMGFRGCRIIIKECIIQMNKVKNN